MIARIALSMLGCTSLKGMSTDHLLREYYESNGGRNFFPEHHTQALEALLYGVEELRSGNNAAAQKRVNAIFKDMPIAARKWHEGLSGTHFKGRQIGHPVAYYGLRMLNQILKLKDPSGAGELQMTAVVVPYANISRVTLNDLKLETVVKGVDRRLLANDAEMLRECTWLFRRWLRAISGGYEIKLIVHQLDEMIEMESRDTGKIIICQPPGREIVNRVPEAIQNETDIWWVIAPSAIPENGGAGFDRHFISGGMGAIADRPLFLSDDAHFIRKAEHMGVGEYSEIERRAYQPQWFQHEFMHHLYRIYPEFELEKEGHQWFDRKKWPEDFEGIYEPDYYAESLFKRLLSAQPSIGEKLQKPLCVPASELSPEQITGEYRRLPVENAWHEVNIRSVGKSFEWSNKAGASWRLEIKDKALWSDEKGPYGVHRIRIEMDTLGNVSALYFKGERYQKKGNR
ncbi:MAG: hypothetical protein ACPGN3_12495 [Opitutales bacterium]